MGGWEHHLEFPWKTTDYPTGFNESRQDQECRNPLKEMLVLGQEGGKENWDVGLKSKGELE